MSIRAMDRDKVKKTERSPRAWGLGMGWLKK